MRGMLDFSSWSTILTTLFSLVLVSLVLVGIRLVFMQTFQRRRERENRQINERLKVLIAAYKTLGGSFTGVLAVEAAPPDVIQLGTEAHMRLAAQAASKWVVGRGLSSAAT